MLDPDRRAHLCSHRGVILALKSCATLDRDQFLSAPGNDHEITPMQVDEPLGKPSAKNNGDDIGAAAPSGGRADPETAACLPNIVHGLRRHRTRAAWHAGCRCSEFPGIAATPSTSRSCSTATFPQGTRACRISSSIRRAQPVDRLHLSLRYAPAQHSISRRRHVRLLAALVGLNSVIAAAR